ncbi:hypothetical protein BH11ACT8_BH11ACT8_07250 [soil metagenome]
MKLNRKSKTAAGIAGLLLVAFPLAACGGSDSDTPDKVQAVATIDNLTGEQTQITVDKDFFPTLDSLGLAPGILGTAGLDGDVLSFPITGGNVSVFEPGSVPNYVVGQIQHEGSGLSLKTKDDSGPVVELRNFNVDPGVSRVYGDVVVDGKVAVTSAYLFRLNGSTLMPLKTEGDTAILEGTKVYLSDVAAGLLNDTYGTDKVTDQVLVGVAKITVLTK